MVETQAWVRTITKPWSLELSVGLGPGTSADRWGERWRELVLGSLP